MKKALLSIIVVILIIAGGFVWLVSGTGPENAPDGEVIIDLTADHMQ